eukprot:GILK01007564.1.p1 GENE.GILK01007564.1~~GILK01007564.1.p1  ORF type:complete len:706 (-),score=167.08 GILK01007564.1:166-2283(-)
MSSSLREAMVQNAVRFLTNDKVRTTAEAQKRTFLVQKGLTAEEIDEAFRRAAATEQSAQATSAAAPAQSIRPQTSTQASPLPPAQPAPVSVSGQLISVPPSAGYPYPMYPPVYPVTPSWQQYALAASGGAAAVLSAFGIFQFVKYLMAPEDSEYPSQDQPLRNGEFSERSRGALNQVVGEPAAESSRELVPVGSKDVVPFNPPPPVSNPPVSSALLSAARDVNDQSVRRDVDQLRTDMSQVQRVLLTHTEQLNDALAMMKRVLNRLESVDTIPLLNSQPSLPANMSSSSLRSEKSIQSDPNGFIKPSTVPSKPSPPIELHHSVSANQLSSSNQTSASFDPKQDSIRGLSTANSISKSASLNVLPPSTVVETAINPNFNRVDAEQQLTRALNLLETANMEELKRTCNTLLVYVNNILKTPSDLRFRKVNTSNKNFKERVGESEGALLFLKAVGFETKSSTLQEFTGGDVVFLEQAKERLLDLLRRLDSSSEPLTGSSSQPPADAVGQSDSLPVQEPIFVESPTRQAPEASAPSEPVGAENATQIATNSAVIRASTVTADSSADPPTVVQTNVPMNLATAASTTQTRRLAPSSAVTAKAARKPWEAGRVGKANPVNLSNQFTDPVTLSSGSPTVPNGNTDESAEASTSVVQSSSDLSGQQSAMADPYASFLESSGDIDTDLLYRQYQQYQEQLQQSTSEPTLAEPNN